MRQRTIFGFIVLTLCILSFTFMAYSNKYDIPLEQSSSFWHVGNDNPNIVMEKSEKNIFTPIDKRRGTCDIYFYNAFSAISATTNSYILSQIKTPITSYKAGNEYCHRRLHHKTQRQRDALGKCFAQRWQHYAHETDKNHRLRSEIVKINQNLNINEYGTSKL